MGEFLAVRRGEFITSIPKFAEETGMSIQKVRTFWKLLEDDKMIVKKSTREATKLTVCNYEHYQDAQQREQQISNRSATTENKGNKETSKEKVKKESPDPPFSTPKFRSVWNEWMEFRKSNNWPRSETYLKRAYPNLEKLSGGNVSTAIAIINQSMDQSWQGLFKLKGDAAPQKAKHGTKGRGSYSPTKKVKEI